jgi:hypothetical protein
MFSIPFCTKGGDMISSSSRLPFRAVLALLPFVLGWIIYSTFSTSPSYIHEQKAAAINYFGLHANSGSSIYAPTPSIPGDSEEYVALCFTAKNESLNLPELFTHYYYHVGIRRFYIMDDGSTPPLSTYSYPIPSEHITFTYYTAEQHHERNNQLFLNDECQRLYGEKHTWMGHFDCDEYLEVVRRNETLVSILKDLSLDLRVGQLGVNWQVHNSNNREVRQTSIRKGYTSCIDDDPASNGEQSRNRHVKSFVRTDRFLDSSHGANQPHTFKMKNDSIAVGEDGREWFTGVDSEFGYPSPWRWPPTRNRLTVHHYNIKSRQEYEEKMLRSQHIEAGKTTWQFFDDENAVPRWECKEMAAYDP